ncbi:MAG: glycosyltransferase [Ignavibacteriales bacterium]|nr:glycosyltransferase [Ignavibacteriales bacterium]
MKILHIAPSFYPAQVYGGPIESTYQLCRYSETNGCDVRVLTTDANGPQAVLDVPTDREVQLAEGVRVRYCERLMGDSVSLTLLRLLPSYIYWADVVHLTGVYSFPTIPTLTACMTLGKPLVWSPRGSLQRWEGSTQIQLKAVWESVCRAVAPKKIVLHATSQEEVTANMKRFPDAGSIVIPNGIEVPEKILHEPTGGVLRLLFLGRLHPKKGSENLLMSCKMLNDNSKVIWSLALAGTGDPGYIKTIRARIIALKLEQYVRMVEEVRGEIKKSYFENSDIVIVPSYTENFGMVVAEALAHGVPVIASKGTPWKRMEAIGCGLLVENDPESLAKAIERMSTMPLCEMGERGREWMKKEFHCRLVAEDMGQLYQKLISGL